jgi:hypothetical protein
MVKSGLEKIILKFHGGFQRYLLTCQANSAFLGRFFCTGQQQLWRPSWNFKIIFIDHFSPSFLSQKGFQISVRIFCVLSGTRNLQCQETQLKVSEFQEDILVSSFGPKNRRNFWISAVASKKSSIQKTLLYN